MDQGKASMMAIKTADPVDGVQVIAQVVSWLTFIAVTILLLIEVRNKCRRSERNWLAKKVQLAGIQGAGRPSNDD